MGKRVCLAVVGLAWLATGMVSAPLHAAETGVAKPQGSNTESWVTLTPVDFKLPFGNIRYPYLDAAGNITFIADDTMEGQKGGHHGIYRCQTADRTLVCLVQAGQTTVPRSDATIKYISGLQMDENAVDFVFRTVDSDGKRGLYHWSGGKLDTVARAGTTVLPGETEPLTLVEYGALHGTHVLYQATTAKRGVTLVLHDLKTGDDRVLCRKGTPRPRPRWRGVPLARRPELAHGRQHHLPRRQRGQPLRGRKQGHDGHLRLVRHQGLVRRQRRPRPRAAAHDPGRRHAPDDPGRARGRDLRLARQHAH